MPRREARLQVTMWTNRDFVALAAEDQRTYLMLVSQPTINLCGVVPLTLGRWARMAPDTPVDSLRASIGRLEAASFVVQDEDSDEILIRSFIRHDGVWRNQKTRAGALEQRGQITSPKILAALDGEIRRLNDERDALSDAPSPGVDDGPS